MQVTDWTRDELREIRASWPEGDYVFYNNKTKQTEQRSYEELYWRYVKALIWKTRYGKQWKYIGVRMGLTNNTALEACRRMQLYIWRLRQEKEKENG